MAGKWNPFSSVLRGSWSEVISRVLLLLVLAGILPSAVAYASGSGTQTEITYSVGLYRPRAEYCAGFDDQFKVRVSSFQVALDENGQPITRINERGARAEVTASVSDPSILTLQVASVSTAPDVQNGGDGNATIPFHANKAGDTTLTLGAILDDGGDIGKASVDIHVVNCAYDVYMNMFGVALGGGIKIWTSGRMITEISDKGGVYPGQNGRMSGSGTLNFTSGFSGAGCTIDYTTYQIPVDLKSPGIENDEFKLNLEFGHGQIGISAHCEDVSAGASGTVDLSGLEMPDLTFPAEGGTISYVTDYKDTHVTMIVTVIPRKE